MCMYVYVCIYIHVYIICMCVNTCVYVYVYVIARAGVIFGIYFTSCRQSGGYFAALPKTSGIYPKISRLPVLYHINTMSSSFFYSSNSTFSALLHAAQRGRYITFFTLVGDISRRQVIFHVGR